MIPVRASNWVDRNDPIEPALARVLGQTLGVPADDPRLTTHALTIRGLVEAYGSEVHVARLLRGIFAEFGQGEPTREAAYTLGIALWHIAKAGLVRDAGLRHARELAKQLPPEPKLAAKLERAILNAPE